MIWAEIDRELVISDRVQNFTKKYEYKGMKNGKTKKLNIYYIYIRSNLKLIYTI